MAISIDYLTQVISIPQADLTPVGGAFYEMDINWFHLQLRDWEDDPNGIFMPTTHDHTDPVDIGGVTIARVVRIINGYTVTFEDGSYVVTLTGANSNILDVTNLNSVSVRSANSAGLVATPELQYSSYEGAVWYDSGTTNVGTFYPIGTRREPVNNMTDALAIAAQRGLGTIHLMTSATLAGLDFSGKKIVGENPVDILVTVDPTAVTNNCKFENVTISGTLDTAIQIRNSMVGSITGMNGFIENCILYNAIITLGGGAQTNIINCWSGVPSPTKPIIDMGGSGQALALQGYTGDIQIQNKTGNEDASVDLRAGSVVVTNTVDAGTLYLRGVGLWENESTFAGTATVYNQLIEQYIFDDILVESSGANTGAAAATAAAQQASVDAGDAETAALAAQAAANQAVTDIGNLTAPDNTSIAEIYKAHFNRRKWDKNLNEITIFEDNKVTPFKVFDTPGGDLTEIDPQ